MSNKSPRRLKLVAQDPQTEAGNRTDEGLIQLIAAGDLHAFTRLVSKNEIPIRRFCYGMLGQQSVADELAQETFLKLWQSRERYRAKGSARACIFAIARNLCLSHIR